jgi:hypothetical protein
MGVITSDKTQEGLADAELLVNMRAGDPTAFATLMRSNNQRLYRLARGFLRDDSKTWYVAFLTVTFKREEALSYSHRQATAEAARVRTGIVLG